MSKSFFLAVSFVAVASAAACARSADEPYTDDGGTGGLVDSGSGVDAGSDTAVGFDASRIDAAAFKDAAAFDVNLDGPPPPPPPPPDGGDLTICNQFDPVGTIFYAYEYFKQSNAGPCPCDGGTQCCYAFFPPGFPFPVDMVCLDRGF